MPDVARPSGEADLARLIAEADGPFEVVGSGSKRGWGRPVAALQRLDLSGFSGVAIYEPEELILEAGAGTPMAELEALVAARSQYFAFEPPDFSRLLGSGGSGTLGGCLACNLSGPRRLKSGAARDHVLGLRGVSGRGEVFKAGARVVKNVTGYDLPKLMANSFGTLAAMTTITMKVLPRPETEETLCLEGLDDGAAVAAMSTAMQSACEVSAAAHLPGKGTYLRLEGIAASVTYRRDALARLLARPVSLLAAEGSARLWKDIRDVALLADRQDNLVWRLSVTPSAAPAVMAAIRETLDARYFLDWAGGLIWLDTPSTEDTGAAAIRMAVGDTGHATLVRAPEALRANADVFQPLPPALAALTARVKDSFDPRRLLNPGRMYRDI